MYRPTRSCAEMSLVAPDQATLPRRSTTISSAKAIALCTNCSIIRRLAPASRALCSREYTSSTISHRTRQRTIPESQLQVVLRRSALRSARSTSAPQAQHAQHKTPLSICTDGIRRARPDHDSGFEVKQTDSLGWTAENLKPVRFEHIWNVSHDLEGTSPPSG